MDDSISDDISFELLPAQQGTVTSDDGEIDLAPLIKQVGQADIITDEYTITQQNWKALADGEVKLDVNCGFGDETKNPQGFTLKAGEGGCHIRISLQVSRHPDQTPEMRARMVLQSIRRAEKVWIQTAMERLNSTLAKMERRGQILTGMASMKSPVKRALTIDAIPGVIFLQ